MNKTFLNNKDQLPLTCSRKGTCCHGNTVFLNPWEIAQLAQEKEISTQQFINDYTEDAGLRLKFNGKQDNRGKSSCNLYVDNFGCSVHKSRPLACRLFPIGRQIQNETVHYIYQGDKFPCLNDCSEVLELPKMTVENYLQGQETELFEQAQDYYLEIVQNLADNAFTLLLDSPLAASGDKETLQQWRKTGVETPISLKKSIDNEWLNLILTPELKVNQKEPFLFTQLHNELLQSKAQSEFEHLNSLEELKNASIKMMTIALFLSISIGANPKALSEHWIEIAKANGASE